MGEMLCEVKGFPVGPPQILKVAIVRTKAFTPTEIRGFLESSERHDLIKHKLFIKKQDPTVANSSPDGSHLCLNLGPSAAPPLPMCCQQARGMWSVPSEIEIALPRPLPAPPAPPQGITQKQGLVTLSSPPPHFPGLLYLKSKRMLFQDRSALAN